MATKKENGSTLRAEVEAEMQAEAREGQKAAIKVRLRRIAEIERSKGAEDERVQKEVEKLEKEIEDIEAGKVPVIAAGVSEFEGSIAIARDIKGYSQQYGGGISIGYLWEQFAKNTSKNKQTREDFEYWGVGKGYFVT